MKMPIEVTAQPTSRTDLDPDDILYRIKGVERDQRVPRDWKPVELDYLKALFEQAVRLQDVD